MTKRFGSYSQSLGSCFLVLLVLFLVYDFFVCRSQTLLLLVFEKGTYLITVFIVF